MKIKKHLLCQNYLLTCPHQTHQTSVARPERFFFFFHKRLSKSRTNFSRYVRNIFHFIQYCWVRHERTMESSCINRAHYTYNAADKKISRFRKFAIQLAEILPWIGPLMISWSYLSCHRWGYSRTVFGAYNLNIVTILQTEWPFTIYMQLADRI